jgi:hypothetical protein
LEAAGPHRGQVKGSTSQTFLISSLHVLTAHAADRKSDTSSMVKSTLSSFSGGLSPCLSIPSFRSCPMDLLELPLSGEREADFPSAHQGDRTYCRSPDNSATISYMTHAFFSESPYSADIPQTVQAIFDRFSIAKSST